MTTIGAVNEGVLRLVVPGRFDQSEHPRFQETYLPWLDDPTVKFIEVDFSQTEYIDSAALGMLLLLRRHCRDRGKIISLSHARSGVQEVLKIAKFDSLFGWTA